GANDAPVAIADVSNANADLEQAGNVLDNDSDVDSSDVLSVISVRNEGGDEANADTSLVGALGTLLLNSDGSWTYMADPTNPAVFSLALGDTATETFTYTVSDGNGGVVEQTLDITIIGVNTTPDAVADTANATEDGAVITGNVGDNDSDPDTGAVLSFSLADNAPDGFQLNGDGSWSFDPGNAAYQSLAEGEQIQLVIDYVVTDEKGASAPSTLTVTITGTNDGPVAVADAATTDENASVTIDVLANDTDADNNAALSVSAAAINTGGGSVAIVNNQLVFDPGADFDGLSVGETATVLIDYTIQDEHGVASAAQATVTVTGSNDAPTVSAISLTGTGGGSSGGAIVGLALSGNSDGLVIHEFIDNDGDGASDTVTESSLLDRANIYGRGLDSGDIDGDGDIDIAIATGTGVWVFTNVGDTDGDGFANYTGVQASTSVQQAVELTDLNGDGLLDVVAGASNGTLLEVINLGDTNGNGVIDEFSVRDVARPTNGWSYSISSGDMNGDGRIDVVSAGWSQGPVVISYNQGDTNGDGQIDYIHQTFASSYALGTEVGDVDGDGDMDFIVSHWSSRDEILYINQGDSNGDGQNEFTAITLPTASNTLESMFADIDGDGDLDIIHADLSGQIDISLNQGDTNNDGLPEFEQMVVDSGTTSSYGIAVGDYDGDGDVDIYVPSNSSGGGRLLTNVGDTNGDGRPDFISEVVTGDIPSWDATFLGAGFSFGGTGTREDGAPVTESFAGDDVDSEDNQASLTYEILTQPDEGSVINNGDGTFTFNPGGDFQDLAFGESRTVSFTYRAIDAQGAASTVETVTIEVAGENDAPTVITADTSGSVSEVADGAANEGTVTHVANGTIAFADIDITNEHTATVTPVGGNYLGTLSLSPVDQNGDTVAWTFEVDDNALEGLAAGETATQDYVVTISDGDGGTVTETVTVTLNGANDAPTAGNIVLQANALGNGGFDNGLTGWNVSTSTSNMTRTDRSTITIDTNGTYIPGDDAVAVLDFAGTVPNGFGSGFGPTISSDSFEGQAGDTVAFTYNLSSGGDHALGFGYIRDANTGAIVQEIFNFNTGFTGSTGVTTVELELDYSGEFIIEFRVGSYDASGGLYIGARMDIGFAGILREGVSEDGDYTFQDVVNQILGTTNDPDGDSLTVSIAAGSTSAGGASVSLNADGSLYYSALGAFDYLAEGETFVDTVTLIVDDGNGGTTTATAEVTVIGENDAPVMVSGAAYLVTTNYTGVVFTAAATDVDASDTIAYSLSGDAAEFYTIDATTGVVTALGDPAFEGVHNIVVTASDGLTTTDQDVAITYYQSVGRKLAEPSTKAEVLDVASEKPAPVSEAIESSDSAMENVSGPAFDSGVRMLAVGESADGFLTLSDDGFSDLNSIGSVGSDALAQAAAEFGNDMDLPMADLAGFTSLTETGPSSALFPGVAMSGDGMFVLDDLAGPLDLPVSLDVPVTPDTPEGW
ncbi:beta strand repeat-containing protein, partial [Maricaulis maris]|uniref:beta strand repeat-containing protein n=1 Tax=Maricaulis maris TaxID=74318 RepID=UPI003B8C1E95